MEDVVFIILRSVQIKLIIYIGNIAIPVFKNSILIKKYI